METPKDKENCSLGCNSSNQFHDAVFKNPKFDLSPLLCCWRNSQTKTLFFDACKTTEEKCNFKTKSHKRSTGVSFSILKNEMMLTENYNLSRKKSTPSALYKLNLSSSRKFQICNINFDINYSYTAETSNNSQSHQKTNEGESVKRNLLNRLDKENNSTGCDYDFIETLEERKRKMFTKKFEGNKEFSIQESGSDVDEMIEYILSNSNNIKKEFEKNKNTNSCKCKKIRCAKYSCNCLRNGLKCDFLCTCVNCFNKKSGCLFPYLDHA